MDAFPLPRSLIRLACETTARRIGGAAHDTAPSRRVAQAAHALDAPRAHTLHARLCGARLPGHGHEPAQSHPAPGLARRALLRLHLLPRALAHLGWQLGRE